MLPPDYHMHTPLCRHAVGEPVELAAQAVKLGLTEIGFSDHSPMPRDDFDDWRMKASELDLYVEKVKEARRTFPQLTIKLALEVDYLPGQERWIKDLSSRHEWDYLIGAVHYVSESWALDNPHQLSEWKTRDPVEVWTAYYDRLIMSAKSGLFDILAHVDLCKKFCIYPKEDYTPLVSKFLETVSRCNVAIELNTAGLRKDCQEIYPSQSIVDLAGKFAVPITFGSDAHAPREVGLNFAEAIASAKRAGYTESCRFSRRQRQKVAL
jgi:histidinol-phosphatase (PHP family)